MQIFPIGIRSKEALIRTLYHSVSFYGPKTIGKELTFSGVLPPSHLQIHPKQPFLIDIRYEWY